MQINSARKSSSLESQKLLEKYDDDLLKNMNKK